MLSRRHHYVIVSSQSGLCCSFILFCVGGAGGDFGVSIKVKLSTKGIVFTAAFIVVCVCVFFFFFFLNKLAGPLGSRGVSWLLTQSQG